MESPAERRVTRLGGSMGDTEEGPGIGVESGEP